MYIYIYNIYIYICIYINICVYIYINHFKFFSKAFAIKSTVIQVNVFKIDLRRN